MRYLVLSDIHANLEALEAVMAAAGPYDHALVLGDLVGYGGGLPAKRWLLAHERKHAPVPELTLTA